MTFRETIEAIDRHFSRPTKIVIMGDLMLDHFEYGHQTRLNPDGPVPIFELHGEKFVVGGAGNVAHNIRSLQANGSEVSVIGVIGNDVSGLRLEDMIKDAGITSHCIVDNNRYTTVKRRGIETRFKSQVYRVDRERKEEISEETACEMLGILRSNAKDADVIVLSDYNKGVLTSGLVAGIKDIATDYDQMVFVDPKPVNIKRFAGATLIRPNLMEASEITGIKVGKDIIGSAKEMCKRLEEMSNTMYAVITCGADGMVVKERGKKVRHEKKEPKDVFDIMGAGDTVIAALAVCAAANYSKDGKGFNVYHAAELASYAAGVVVGKAGTATVDIEELKTYIRVVNGF